MFTTCIIDYLTNSVLDGFENVVIYSDRCGYQNRKLKIEQKYTERGHTQMEWDGVHSVIEQSLKTTIQKDATRKERHPAVYVSQHYVESARKNPSPYEVKYVDFSFFVDYSQVGGYSLIRPGIGVGSVTVSDSKVLKYTVDGKIMYKTGYGENYNFLPEPRKNSQ